jgi:hypothetical protein
LHGLSTYVVFCFCTHVSINAGVGQAAQQPLGLLPLFVNHSFNAGFLFFYLDSGIGHERLPTGSRWVNN